MEMFENVASLAREPSIAFGQEIINRLLLLKDEINQCLFNDGDAQAFTYIWNPFTVKLAISQWELVNKKNSYACSAMKVH